MSSVSHMPQEYSRTRQKDTATTEQIVIQAQKLVTGGDALAFVQGKAVFVQGALPGETVAARLTARGHSFDRAVAERILEPHIHRIEPRCSHYGHCGGCNLQHFDYAAQLTTKQEILSENLRRLGGLDADVTGSITARGSTPYGYRSRVQLHLEGGRCGFRARGAHRLVKVDGCPVATAALQEPIVRLCRHPEEVQAPRFSLIDGAGQIFRSDRDHEAALEIDGRHFRFAADSFVQANIPSAVEVGIRLRGWITAPRCIDLYAGAGFFSSFLEPSLERICVEADEANAAYIARNVRGARVLGCTVERALPQLPDWRDACLILDPPRSGLSAPVRAALLDRQPAQLAYLSCDPAALARDLSVLKKVLRIESIELFDFFPQTAHVETLVLMRGGAAE